MVSVTDTTQQLQGLTEAGKAPERRVTTAKAVRELFDRARRAYDKRHERNARVKGLVDGNQPYNQALLDKNGQRYRANFNNGEAESYLATAQTAFYDLFSEVETYAVARLPDELETPDGPEIEDAVTKNFHWLLKQHKSFDYNIQLSIHDMVLYGSGPQVWEGTENWQSRAIPHNRVYFPDDSPSNVCDLERFMVAMDYRVDQLWDFVRDEETAARAGWNVAEVKRAIMKASEETVNGQFTNGANWVDYQRYLRENNMTIGDKSKVVKCVRLFYKEFSGKVSELLVWQDGESTDFLYKGYDKYESFHNCICAFWYDRGDGTAHSVRGLGTKMYQMLLSKMRLQLATVDAAFMRASLVFQAAGSSAVSQQTLSVTSLGPFTVVPHGLNYLNTNNAGVIDAPLAVARDLDGTLSSNLGQYRARLEKPEGNPRTATEVQTEIQKQNILGKTQIARFYQQLDEYYAEVFRRAVLPLTSSDSAPKYVRDAVEFQRRCEQDGVPFEILKRMSVTARRSVGQGSAYMRSMVLMQMFGSLYPVLPEDGKVLMVDDLIAAQAGRDQVKRYNPKPQMRTKEAQQRWEAQIENDTLRNRGQVLVTPYQNHVIHLQEHLNFAAQAANSVQQGGDPADVLATLQATGAHCALHIQPLSQDPTRQDAFKALYEQFQELGKIVDELQRQMEQQVQANAEKQAMAARAKAVAEGTDPETQLKQAELQAKIQRDNAKAAAQIQLKQQKQAADMALKDAQTASGIRRDTVQLVADQRLKEQEAEAKEQLAKAKAED